MNIRHPFVKLAALGALVTALPLLMAPSGGYPTRPTFATVNSGGPCAVASLDFYTACAAGNAGYSWISTGGATDQKLWDVYVDSGGAMHFRLINDARGSASDWMTVTRTAASSAAVSIPGLETTGAITLTYTSGCGSGTATASGKYYKIGHVVTVLITAATLCGTGSSLITFAGMPSAIWPSTAMLATAQVASASGEVSGVAQINNGGPVLIYAAPALTTVSGFTITQSFTYALP